MFNGLIREIAQVQSFQKDILSLRAKFKPKLGDSIAVNGACLSVVELFKTGFSVELSSESQAHLALENYKERVHIEPAMKLNERVDGHLMQGHIDGIGVLEQIKKRAKGVDFYIKVPSHLAPLMANKGSIGVDGVSLTINEVLKEHIRLTIIPISFRESLFSSYKIGRRVNLESDLLARYVARLMEFKGQKELSWQDVERISYLY